MEVDTALFDAMTLVGKNEITNIAARGVVK
jgi:hypothetical protein